MKYGAIILCGGLSSRMGRPKALLPWRGKTMIEHVTGILRPIVDEVVVVTSEKLDLPKLDAKIVRDRESNLGPLAGMREGLEASSAELCYGTSTDAPYLTPDFVRKMLSFGTAAAPVVDGVVQPLSAVYPVSLKRAANELIAAKRMGLHLLLEAGGFRKVMPEELPETQSIRNFNTPEEYLEAVRNDQATGG
jgi:molybdopterin-guanine dinucleotide biosynthesis protein A